MGLSEFVTAWFTNYFIDKLTVLQCLSFFSCFAMIVSGDHSRHKEHAVGLFIWLFTCTYLFVSELELHHVINLISCRED